MSVLHTGLHPACCHGSYLLSMLLHTSLFCSVLLHSCCHPLSGPASSLQTPNHLLPYPLRSVLSAQVPVQDPCSLSHPSVFPWLHLPLRSQRSHPRTVLRLPHHRCSHPPYTVLYTLYLLPAQFLFHSYPVLYPSRRTLPCLYPYPPVLVPEMTGSAPDF